MSGWNSTTPIWLLTLIAIYPTICHMNHILILKSIVKVLLNIKRHENTNENQQCFWRTKHLYNCLKFLRSVCHICSCFNTDMFYIEGERRYPSDLRKKKNTIYVCIKESLRIISLNIPARFFDLISLSLFLSFSLSLSYISLPISIYLSIIYFYIYISIYLFLSLFFYFFILFAIHIYFPLNPMYPPSFPLALSWLWSWKCVCAIYVHTYV